MLLYTECCGLRPRKGPRKAPVTRVAATLSDQSQGVKFRTRTSNGFKEKKKKMTKTYKAVLSTLAVLCLLFMGSGVAQAQLCVAQAQNVGKVRAEGITEVVASIELRCGQPTENTFGFNQIPARIDIAVELNARITNGISDTRVVEVLADDKTLAYKSREIDLKAFRLGGAQGAVDGNMPIDDSVFNGVDAAGGASMVGGKLSEDSTTIVWKNVATGQDDTTLEGFNIPEDDHPQFGPPVAPVGRVFQPAY